MERETGNSLPAESSGNNSVVSFARVRPTVGENNEQTYNQQSVRETVCGSAKATECPLHLSAYPSVASSWSDRVPGSSTTSSRSVRQLQLHSQTSIKKGSLARARLPGEWNPSLKKDSICSSRSRQRKMKRIQLNHKKVVNGRER